MTEMIEHEGIVRSSANGRATIAVQTGGCSGCSHQSGCGLGRMAGEGKSTEMTLKVAEAFEAGTSVILSLPRDRMVLAGLLAYLLPTVTLLIGASLAAGQYGTDALTAVGGFLGLLIGLLGTRAIPSWIPVPTVRRRTALPVGQAITFYKNNTN